MRILILAATALFLIVFPVAVEGQQRRYPLPYGIRPFSIPP